MTALPNERVEHRLAPTEPPPELQRGNSVRLTFVVPVKDEAENLRDLTTAIAVTMESSGERSFEVLFVDDGSEDASWQVLKDLVGRHPDRIRAVKLRRNFGKAAALMVGFRLARGEVIITMDGDLQDDPSEVPKLLERLDQGYDLVCGWKEKRHDPLSKTIPSKIFNAVTRLLTGVRLHDFNCGFKVYRRQVLQGLRLYGELHRYIPVLAHDLGFRITEMPVRHHPRRHGRSKFGTERFVRGLLDLLTVLATTRYLQRPAHLFGGAGVLLGVIGTSSIAYLGVLWVLGYRPIGNRPLLFFGILLVIVAVQLLSLGILAELFVRNSTPRSVDDMLSDSTPE